MQSDDDTRGRRGSGAKRTVRVTFGPRVTVTDEMRAAERAAREQLDRATWRDQDRACVCRTCAPRRTARRRCRRRLARARRRYAPADGDAEASLGGAP